MFIKRPRFLQFSYRGSLQCKRVNLNVSFFFRGPFTEKIFIACARARARALSLRVQIKNTYKNWHCFPLLSFKAFVNTIRLLVLVFCAIANSSASRKRFLIENSPLTVIKYSTSATTKGLTMKRVVLKSHQCCYMTITVHYDTNASIINSSRFQTLSELGKENPN